MKISICPDDLLLFDATITDQYVALMEADLFTLDEIEIMRLNGLGSAYFQDSLKEEVQCFKYNGLSPTA